MLSVSAGIHRRKQSIGGTAFDPLSLFAGGARGAWYDATDPATCWQDVNASSPAAVGQPLGRLDDKSGNGNALVQATATKRPLVGQDGAATFIDTDGAGRTLELPVGMSTPAWSADTVIVGLRRQGTGYQNPIWTHSNGLILVLNGATPETYDGAAYCGGGNVPQGTDVVLSRRAVAGGAVSLCVDGTQVAASTAQAGLYGTTSGHVLSQSGAASFLDGCLYGLILIDRWLTDAEHAAAVAWMQQRMAG